jgi:hypothetical protein
MKEDEMGWACSAQGDEKRAENCWEGKRSRGKHKHTMEKIFKMEVKERYLEGVD